MLDKLSMPEKFILINLMTTLPRNFAVTTLRVPKLCFFCAAGRRVFLRSCRFLVFIFLSFWAFPGPSGEGFHRPLMLVSAIVLKMYGFIASK